MSWCGDAIDWRSPEGNVRRLRQRIFTAARAGELGTLRNLQVPDRPWANAVKLGPDREDVDLRRVGVKLDFVGCPFDAVAVRSVSFDDPGTCPVPPWAEAFLGDLVDGFGECVAESVRGKSPPGWEPGGGSRGSFA